MTLILIANFSQTISFFRLRIEVHQLRERKTERIQQYSQLSDEEKSLSAMTGSFSLSDGIKFERVPSEDQILQVKNHIVQLKVCTYTSFSLELSICSESN